jgi:hypothetical protein
MCVGIKTHKTMETEEVKKTPTTKELLDRAEELRNRCKKGAEESKKMLEKYLKRDTSQQ